MGSLSGTGGASSPHWARHPDPLTQELLHLCGSSAASRRVWSNPIAYEKGLELHPTAQGDLLTARRRPEFEYPIAPTGLLEELAEVRRRGALRTVEKCARPSELLRKFGELRVTRGDDQ